MAVFQIVNLVMFRHPGGFCDNCVGLASQLLKLLARVDAARDDVAVLVIKIDLVLR